MSDKDDKPAPQREPKAPAREEKLAAALRANLRRRKTTPAKPSKPS